MNRFKTGISLLSLLFIITSPRALWAQTLDLESQVIEYTLDNGMKLLMVERHEAPRVVCHIYYRVGGVYERPGITGISHFHEHMMFKGTRTMGTSDFEKNDAINRHIDEVMDKIYREKFWSKEPDMEKVKIWQAQADSLMRAEKATIIKDDLWEFYMKNGGTGLNASTGQEITGYYVTLPANKVELQMWLESDRLMNPCFREFYSEKEVVREERRLSENRPGWLFQEQLNASFFAASPYSWGVIGWDVDLQKMTRQDMYDFNKTWYIPNNAVAVYVGDIQPEEIIALAKKYFGRIPKGPDPEPVRTTEPKPYCEKRLYGEADAPPSVTIYYHVPAEGHPDDAVIRVISGLLNGNTGRLYKKLVKEKGIAVDAYGYGGGMAYAGRFAVGGRPKAAAGHTPEELELAIYEELEALKNTPVPDYELQKVKNRTEAGMIRGLSSNMRLASQLGRSELGLGWRDIPASLQRLKAVSAEDVMRVAQTCFVKDNRTVGILVRKN